MPKRKHSCPRCGSSNAAKIVYGEPSENYLDTAPIVLGGCVVSPDSPTTCCLDCDYRWGGKTTDFLANMRFFRVGVGGYFGPSYTIEVDRTNETITYRHTNDELFDGFHLQPLTIDIWSKLIRGLARCEFVDWLDEYTDKDVLDGTSWSVEIVLPNGEEVCKGGSNAYPGRWNQFCRLMSTVSVALR